jgi:uncharacterized membrane protein YdjX (TVP38/TMEM64 family)
LQRPDVTVPPFARLQRDRPANSLHVQLMRLVRRSWPFLLLLAAIAAAWAAGLPQQISWSALARNQGALAAWVASHPVVAPVCYVAVYAVAVALSFPESAVLTVAGGLLFGTLPGGALAVLGSTMGAVVLFLAVRYHLADALASRAGKFLDRVRARLQRDGFSYMLAIRLLPVFPFWLVNLAAALSGMRLLPYMVATLLGIIPATLIYASIGAGLGQVLAAGGEPDLALVFQPHIVGPLVALALLSLLPVVWRHWRHWYPASLERDS